MSNGPEITQSSSLQNWVKECADITKPKDIYWVDGSDEEYEFIKKRAIEEGAVTPLDEKKHPGCLYSRSNFSDVARTEHLTFICSEKEEDAGPINNWMDPAKAKQKLLPLYEGVMKDRTLYVIPYLLGPVGSPSAKVGVEITDSIYVVLNMRIMARIGKPALDTLGSTDNFVKGFHSLGDLSPERRFIMHFPETREIWSIGSGYGGNALLGKKCHALRIASIDARNEGWMAEHMLVMGLESPEGDTTYIAAAFPSACGKTNLAMLIPPKSHKGWKVWCVGDDIAWMRIGEDGRLWAINPENGFFGVAPGTSEKTNPNAMQSVAKNAIFTNVLYGDDNTIWWEGMGTPAPASGVNWKGEKWTPESEDKGAHPNSRFTAPAVNCPVVSPKWEDPKGVPISAIIFGGRRAKDAPLVYEATDWKHGTFVGASMAPEATAAAVGQVGVKKRSSMAMRPFCGYNMADYFDHWLKMGEKIPNPPGIFHVNWFRTDDEGKIIWPGFGENIRVLQWIRERVLGQADESTGKTQKTAIGFQPTVDGIDTEGLEISKETLEDLLSVNKEDWKPEIEEQAKYFGQFGTKLPAAIQEEHDAFKSRLGL